MSTRTITFNDGFSSASAPTGVDGISNWVTAQAYLVSDVVIQGSKIYECLIAHTAGVFATDLAAVKWGEISQGAVDHTALSNIGTNTHAQIDTHLANTSNPHSVTKAQVGLTNVDDTSDATKNAASVTLTNKTITGADFRTPIRLDMKQDTLANLTTYASTAADGQLCFATDTKATYVVKNNSLSSVGGAGAVINYILAPDADSGSTGWATYKNASGASTPDGTITGTANSTFAVSASTALRGTSNFLFTKNSGASRIGEGFYYPFTIDPSDKGKVLQCSFEYQIDSGTFVDDAMEFFIWDVTNSRLIAPAPSKLKNSGIIERFAFEFQSSIDSTSYRLFAHIGVATDSSNTIRFDNFILGPQAKLYGSALTDWVSYTPTGTWVTNTTYQGKYRRVGDSLEIEARVALTGAPTGTFTLNLPSGFSIDTSKIPSGSVDNTESIGIASFNVAGVRYVGAVGLSSSTAIMINTHGGGGPVNATIPGTFASGSVIQIQLQVPIVGWSSSQVFSQDADVRVVDFKGSSSGTQAVTANVTDVTFTTVKDSHSAFNGSQYVVAVPGDYLISTTLADSASSAVRASAYVNGSSVNILGTTVAGEFGGGATILPNLKAGDTISIRIASSITIATGRSLSIQRISGPSQIAASESVSMLYKGTPAGTIDNTWNNITTIPTKIKDSHGAYSGGVFTVPTSGTYDLSAFSWIVSTLPAASNSYLGVSIDGNSPDYISTSVNSSAASNRPLSIAIFSIPLRAGQTISLRTRTEGTTNSFVTSSAIYHQLSITKSGQY